MDIRKLWDGSAHGYEPVMVEEPAGVVSVMWHAVRRVGPTAAEAVPVYRIRDAHGDVITTIRM